VTVLGKLVRRQRLPKNDVGDFLSWKDLNVAMNLPCYGRVFRIYDCDRWTRVGIDVCFINVLIVVVSRPWSWFQDFPVKTLNLQSWSSDLTFLSHLLYCHSAIHALALCSPLVKETERDCTAFSMNSAHISHAHAVK